MTDNIEPKDAENVVAYRVGRLEKAVEEGFEKQSAKMEELVSHFAPASDLIALARRVKSLERDRSWIVKIVIGAVVMALLSLVLVAV